MGDDMILAFPKRHANDNQEQRAWVCIACNNGAFLLEFIDNRTMICCSNCGVDVTAHILPSLEGHPHASN